MKVVAREMRRYSFLLTNLLYIVIQRIGLLVDQRFYKQVTSDGAHDGDRINGKIIPLAKKTMAIKIPMNSHNTQARTVKAFHLKVDNPFTGGLFGRSVG